MLNDACITKLVAWSTPRHNLNQWWLIVNWNKFQWNLKQKTRKLFWRYLRSFCSGLPSCLQRWMEEYPHKTPSGVIKDVNFIYKPVPDDQAGTGRRLGSIHSASSCEVRVLKWQCCALVDNNGYYTACAVDGKRAINVVTWCAARVASVNQKLAPMKLYKQRVLMHGHQGWNVRHGLCHIYMIYVYIWVVYSFCLFCCLFIIVTTQFVALYKPCKPKPKFR